MKDSNPTEEKKQETKREGNGKRKPVEVKTNLGDLLKEWKKKNENEAKG